MRRYLSFCPEFVDAKRYVLSKISILCRYQGKSKALMYDVTKILSALKGKRGDHRAFRLAENLCLNLIFSLRDFFLVKREGKVFVLVSKLEVLFIF